MSTATPFRRALVAIDGNPDNGVYAALLPDSTWNGWARPTFPAESVHALRVHPSANLPGCGPLIRFGADGALIVNEAYGDPDAGPESMVTVAPELIGGVPHWAIGAGSWVWAEVAVCDAEGCDIPAFVDGMCEAHADAAGQ